MNNLSRLHQRIQSKGVLLGCLVEGGSTATAELAAMMGYDVLWIDMEHHSIDFRDTEQLCQAAKAGGALSLLRIRGPERPEVLSGLETGADMVMVPMVESANTTRKMVEYGKYKPLGNRGFNGSSRGFGYGLGNPVANMEQANRESHLLIQIETMEGVSRCDEILSVAGISGALVGPGDLSVSMGKPLAFDDREFQQVFADTIRAVRAHNKIAITATGHAGLMKVAVAAGVQIIVTAGVRTSLKAHWAEDIRNATALIQAARSAA